MRGLRQPSTFSAIRQFSSIIWAVGLNRDATSSRSNGFAAIRVVAVVRPSAVIRPSPGPALCVKAPFDTPDIGCFACSLWGQHSIIQCRRFIAEKSPVQLSLLLTRQQRASVVGSTPSTTTTDSRGKRAGWRTAGASSVSNPTITRCSVEERKDRDEPIQRICPVKTKYLTIYRILVNDIGRTSVYY